MLFVLVPSLMHQSLPGACNTAQDLNTFPKPSAGRFPFVEKSLYKFENPRKDGGACSM